MSDTQQVFENKLASIRAALLEHYGASESFFYEFSVAVENEMTDMEASEKKVFLSLAEAQGYVPSISFENNFFDPYDDNSTIQ